MNPAKLSKSCPAMLFFVFVAGMFAFCVGPNVAWSAPTYIDNTSVNFTSTGTWTDIAGHTEAYPTPGSFKESGTGVVTATWAIPATLPAGTYEVWANWRTWSTYGTKIGFSVTHGGGVNSRTVNQSTPESPPYFGNNNRSTDNYLGVFCFTPGSGHKITLTHTAEANNLAAADAIKLVPIAEAIGTALDISDVPLVTQVPAATPNLMFVLDDSGSMDWEFMTSEANGIFTNKYYVFDNPGDNVYDNSTILSGADRRQYRSQWSGYNKLYYSPTSIYAPWPTRPNADPANPRSHPTSATQTQTFNLGSTYLSVSSVVAGEVTLDNKDGAAFTTSNPGFTFESGSDDSAEYLASSYYANANNAWAEWVTPAALTGNYDVYVRWTYSANRDRAVTYKIYEGGVLKATTAAKNQRVVGTSGQWQLLGTYAFAGGLGKVRVTRSNDGDSTSADAVKFTPAGAASTITIINAHYYTWNDLNSDGVRAAVGEDIYLVNLTNPIAYYRHNDTNANNIVDDGELIAVAAAAVPATVRTTAQPTAADAYTVERQNFANWYSFYRRRELAATASIAQVINGISNMKVGIYSINGKIVQPVLNVKVGASDETASLLNTLYSYQITAQGTPLQTGLRNAGQYFDKDDGLTGGIGASPIAEQSAGGACQQNFIVLMTDGYYNGASPALTPANADGDNGAPFADNWSNTLADVAMKYYEEDLANTIDNSVAPISAYDNATWQHVVTYTVAFGVTGTLNPADYPASNNFKNAGGFYPVWPDPATSDARKIDDLWHAALNGRGSFMAANNSEELVAGLLAVMQNISSRAGSESSLTLNSEGLSGDLSTETRLYETTYLPSDWSGDVKSYRIDLVTKRPTVPAEWSARQILQDFLDTAGGAFNQRAIGTFDGTTGRPFRYLNLSAAQQALLNNNTTVVDYIRGDKSKEIQNGGTLRNRTWRLGDIVNSMAVFNNDVLYVGANDGMLHALDANTGDELFAYVPNLVFANLYSLTQSAYTHKFFVNGSPLIKAVGNTTYLIGGLLKGGKGYYCLNVSPDKIETFTDPGSSVAAKETELASMVKWEFSGGTCPNMDADLGYSYSPAAMLKSNATNINTGQPLAGYMVFFANGYSSPSGSAVLYCLNPETGALIKKIDTKSGAGNGLSAPILIDVDNDRKIDYAYAGDLKGNLWKFDLTAPDPANWDVAYKNGGNPEPLFRTPSPGQPITSKPAVMYAPPPEQYLAPGASPTTTNPGFFVIFGTGKYLGLTDLTDNSQQAVYGIWDYGDDADDTEFLGQFNPATGRLDNLPVGYTLAREYDIYAGANVTADFTAEATGSPNSGAVTFLDHSSGTPVSWLWDFGDGTATSTVPNPPVHNYTTPGTYTASLTVSKNIPEPISSQKTAIITVTHDLGGTIATDYHDNPPLVDEDVLAYFESSVIGTVGGLTVQFANLSKGNVAGATYLWDFGDGQTSTALAPSHTFVAIGSYTVSLTVSPIVGIPNTRSNNSYITIATPWIVNIELDAPSGVTAFDDIRVFNDTMRKCPAVDQNQCKHLDLAECKAPNTTTSEACQVYTYYYCTSADGTQKKNPGPCPDDPETNITELTLSDYPVYVGWYFNLADVGERMVVDADIIDGRAELVSHVPQATMCSTEGYSWIFSVDAVTGGPIDAGVFDANRDFKINQDDKVYVEGKWYSISAVKLDVRAFQPGVVADADTGTSLSYYTVGEEGDPPVVKKKEQLGTVIWQEME